MERKKEFGYKLQNIALNVDNVEEIQFPDIKDRIIEKTGDTVEFSMNEVEKNMSDFIKYKKEQEAQVKLSEATIENVEHFHPFVLEMSEQDLLTAWLYKETKGKLEQYKKNLDVVDEAITNLEDEIAQIKEQIPEFTAEVLPEAKEEENNE